MPYKKTSDLPRNIREYLPRHAQEIYLAAFDSAWEQYRDSASRRNKSSREEVAHKVA